MPFSGFSFLSIDCHWLFAYLIVLQNGPSWCKSITNIASMWQKGRERGKEKTRKMEERDLRRRHELEDEMKRAEVSASLRGLERGGACG